MWHVRLVCDILAFNNAVSPRCSDYLSDMIVYSYVAVTVNILYVFLREHQCRALRRRDALSAVYTGSVCIGAVMTKIGHRLKDVKFLFT